MDKVAKESAVVCYGDVTRSGVVNETKGVNDVPSLCFSVPVLE